MLNEIYKYVKTNKYIEDIRNEKYTNIFFFHKKWENLIEYEVKTFLKLPNLQEKTENYAWEINERFLLSFE